jgi:hypothetical protein
VPYFEAKLTKVVAATMLLLLRQAKNHAATVISGESDPIEQRSGLACPAIFDAQNFSFAGNVWIEVQGAIVAKEMEGR